MPLVSTRAARDNDGRRQRRQRRRCQRHMIGGIEDTCLSVDLQECSVPVNPSPWSYIFFSHSFNPPIEYHRESNLTSHFHVDRTAPLNFCSIFSFLPPARPGDETTHLGRECAVQLTVAREREVIQRAQVAERRRDATAQLRRLEERGDRCGDDTSRSQRQRVIYGVVTVPTRRPRILEAMAIKNERTRRPPRPPPPPPYADELTRTDIIRHHQWHATETS